jgi:hypothetical protein
MSNTREMYEALDCDHQRVIAFVRQRDAQQEAAVLDEHST